MTIQADMQVLEDLDALLDYNWADEEADYEACLQENPDVDPENHIFIRMNRLLAWLQGVCPEWYHGDRR